MTLTIDIIDNLHILDDYNYLLRDETSGKVAVVDAADAKPILSMLDEKGWSLDYIFATHHHWDHTGGIPDLVRETGAKVVGYMGDAARIPQIEVALEAGEVFSLGKTDFKVLHIPGHTLGNIAYYCETERALFSGDMLFSIGCGRMFEGNAEQFHASLQSLAALPEDTRLYAGHEYTLANLEFALSCEPKNAALLDYREKVKLLREKGLPSLPSLMSDEKRLNPFLRAKDAADFARLRNAKDAF